ncbi:MAG: hypothetical protein GEV07_09790 [Streptosporangiales bacterium]|nr:hypothetical protein [Streptosporangiales bacterium]
MTKKALGWYAVGGIGATILAFAILPNIIAGLIFVAIVAAPVVGYFMLDPSQRRRLRRVSRKQIGS